MFFGADLRQRQTLGMGDNLLINLTRLNFCAIIYI